jgi:hypothetical protein
MKPFLKILGIVAVSLFLICGCKNGKGKTDGGYYPAQTNSVIQSGFNEEVYVWEDFIFSTNRVEKTR